MELPQGIIPLILAFILFSYIIIKNKRQSRFVQLPPGPRKLPFIGNLHQLGGSLPHHTLMNLAKKHGPIMHLQLGEVSTIIVSSPEIAKAVMRTHDLTFASRAKVVNLKEATYDYTDIVFAPYGDYWKQLRKICTQELLSLKRVQSYRDIRENEVQNFINSISSSCGTIINLSEKSTSLANSITSIAAFGKSYEGKEEFITLLAEAITVNGGASLVDLFPSLKFLKIVGGRNIKAIRRHKKFDEIFSNIIDEHQARRINGKLISDGEEDLVDVLLRIQESGERDFSLTKDNIKAVLKDIFSAGTEPVSTTINWAMSELMRNPEILKKAQTEVREVLKGNDKIDETDIKKMNYLKMVIKETLRLHPPVPLSPPREARETCQINGYDVPIKTRVIVNVWAINRDPNYWEHPDNFNPDRFDDSSIDYKGANFEFIPFGAGRRICPGILFGTALVELPIAQLLYHFDWKLPKGTVPEELDMTGAFGIAVRRKEDLFVIPIPYKC